MLSGGGGGIDQHKNERKMKKEGMKNLHEPGRNPNTEAGNPIRLSAVFERALTDPHW